MKTILLNLLFNCLWTSTALGYQIAICGGSVKDSDASIIEIEQIAREETKRLTNDEVVSVHRMCELLGTNELPHKKKKLFGIGTELEADYIVRMNVIEKNERIFFSTSLMNIKAREIAVQSQLSFHSNPPELRRMVRIVLRDLYQFFFDLENPIIVTKNTQP